MKNNLKMTISQYYGNISVRLYDIAKKKNVAKIEVEAVMKLLQDKIDNKEYDIVESGKGNTLDTIILK